MNGTWLFQLIVTQFWQVTLLAGIVWAVAKYVAKDRPHLAHALWALVLLKCMLPPIVASPTSLFSWLPHSYRLAVQEMSWSATTIEQRVAQDQAEGVAPLRVRVLPGASALDRIDEPSRTLATARDAKRGGNLLVKFALCAWSAIAVGVFTVSVLRLGIFLRRVKQVTLPTPPSLDLLVANLSKRIGLSRKVRVRLVDAAIGPAVVGFMRPTILMPKVIVEGSTSIQLEPLLAHELIHVRRGDLVWAMLQGISVSLWWFHPLVWLAERLLTCEAERSCDEETIAGLGCSPAMYARSLLEVMERKHQLRAAPSLPGVRPVDITANRLERIMRLGHGSYRQRPWWVVAVWLIGCAMFLPGGAWLTAQENPEQKSNVFKEASFSSENRLESAGLPSAPANPPVVEKEQTEELAFQFEHVLELADVLERLYRERSLAKADLEKELIRLLTAHAALELEGKTEEVDQSLKLALEDPAARAIKSTRLAIGGTSLRVANNQLYIRATPEKRKAIEQCIAHFRQFGFASIVTEISSYEVPRKLAEKELAAISEKFASKGSAAPRYRIEVKGQGKVTSDLGLAGTLTLASHCGYVVLDNSEIARFKEWLAEDDNRDVSQVSAPRVTALSGQLTTVEIGDTREFTVSHKLVKTKDREPTAVPVTQQVMSGSRYEVRATLADGKDADMQSTRLDVKFKRTVIERVDQSTQKLNGIATELDVKRPVVRERTLETSVELGVNQALVVMQTSKDKTSITLVRCTPLAAPIATIPQTNLGDQAPAAYVTISDELQSDLEVALLKQKIQQLGIRDFRIAQRQLQVSNAEDWRAAVNAFKELRSNKYAHSVSASVNSTEGSFSDGDTAYQPIQAFGPFVRHQSVPWLTQVPYVNRLVKGPVKLNVPSDEEIIQALEKDLSQKGRALNGVEKGKLKITTIKIREFYDPARFVPLIGDSILHHSHYKCELTDPATQELKHVAYIDYCQFQMAVGSAK